MRTESWYFVKCRKGMASPLTARCALANLDASRSGPLVGGVACALASEGPVTHELLHLGVSLRLVQAIALLHLSRETIHIPDRSRLTLGDLGPLRRNIQSRNVI